MENLVLASNENIILLYWWSENELANSCVIDLYVSRFHEYQFFSSTFAHQKKDN